MRLYRFEKPEDVRWKTLQENRLWMSIPAHFNDPYDCQIKISFDGANSTISNDRLRAAVKELYNDYNLEYGVWLYTKEILEEIQAWGDGRAIEPGKPRAAYMLEEQVAKFGVQCFCMAPVTNPLMWAHYASNHQGFCIEYEYTPMTLAKENDYEFSMQPVVYSSRVPDIDFMEIVACPRKAISKLSVYKTSHWAYEEEVRLKYFPLSRDIENLKLGGVQVPLPNGLKVKGIICGMRIAPEIVRELEIVAKNLDVPIGWIINNGYSLEVVALPKI